MRRARQRPTTRPDGDTDVPRAGVPVTRPAGPDTADDSRASGGSHASVPRPRGAGAHAAAAASRAPSDEGSAGAGREHAPSGADARADAAAVSTAAVTDTWETDTSVTAAAVTSGAVEVAAPSWHAVSDIPAAARYRFGPDLDPELLVWEPDTFPAFARAADYDRAVELLQRQSPGMARAGGADRPLQGEAQDGQPGDGESVAGESVDGDPADGDAAHGAGEPREDGAALALLPSFRCGAPHAEHPTQRCGRALGAARARFPVAGVYGYDYRASRCGEGPTPHRALFLSTIEGPTLAMIAEAYTPESLAGAIRAIRARTESDARRLATLTREAAAHRAAYRDAGEQEARARLEGDALDEAHYRERRRTAQHMLQAVEAEAVALRRARAETTAEGDVARRLAIVREIAGQAGALLTRAQRVPRICRTLVRVLTRALYARLIAPGIALVEVEFPNGARAARLIVLRRFRSTQPERAVALHAVAHARDLDAVARTLAAPRATTRLPGRDRTVSDALWTADRLRTLAVLHRYFESVPLRTAPLETLGALAARTGASLAELRAAALDGLLGPLAVVQDGTELGAWRLAPTERELESALPTYATAQVAARMGWHGTDVVAMWRLHQLSGIHAGRVKNALVHRAKRAPTHGPEAFYAFDLANRRHVRVSALPEPLRTALARAVAAATTDGTDRPEGTDPSHLAPEGRRHDGRTPVGSPPRSPARTPATRRRDASPLGVPAAGSDGTTPALAPAFVTAATAAAAAAGYPATAAEDWWPPGLLMQQLRARVGFGSDTSVKAARLAGRITAIAYQGPSRVVHYPRSAWLVYCPASIAHQGDAAAVRRWLRGEGPHPRGSAPRG